MLRFKQHLPFFALTAILLVAVTAFAVDLPCEIVQYKLGRVYFNAGVEEYIYPGCRYTIISENDTVYTGQIEYSYTGISMSHSVQGSLDTLEIEKLRALIEPARVDSSTAIQLLSFGIRPSQLVRRAAPDTVDYLPEPGGMFYFAGSSDAGNTVNIIRSKTPHSDWKSNCPEDCQGFFSRDVPPESFCNRCVTLPVSAPYIVVLMPNLSKTVNEHGSVTTSLYYRFDIETLWGTFFRGDIPKDINRLYVNSDSGERSYSFDPLKGRQLLTKERNKIDKLNLGYPSELAHIAEYFADIISRDKIAVELNKGRLGDLWLSYIPIDIENPTTSLEHIYHQITRHEASSRRIKESLEILRNHIVSAKKASDVETQLHYCRLADRTLQSDLGVFPLFRPTIYFVAKKNLKNARFDESGYLDLSSLTKLILPVPEREDQP